MKQSPHNIVFGQDGESQAAKYLISQGYSIIQTNFRTKFGEIDIIARQKGVLVFVEVKNRTNDYFDDASTVVSAKKLAKLTKTANIFLSGFKWRGDYRFDMITIFAGDLEHFENITLDDWKATAVKL